jgi:hypothetical protein
VKPASTHSMLEIAAADRNALDAVNRRISARLRRKAIFVVRINGEVLPTPCTSSESSSSYCEGSSVDQSATGIENLRRSRTTKGIEG